MLYDLSILSFYMQFVNLLGWFFFQHQLQPFVPHLTAVACLAADQVHGARPKQVA